MSSVAGDFAAGIDLSSFDDFVSQVLHPEGERMGLPTLFFPMLRMERIALDEPRGSIPSLAEMFEKKSGPLACGLSGPVRLILVSGRRHKFMNSRILTVPEPAHVPAPGIPAIFPDHHSIIEHYGWALGILVAAGLSDGVDGLLARR